MTPRELDVLGVRVDMVDERAALARIEQLHDEVPPRFVSYVNPHTINLACRDPAFRPILDGAGLRLPDGFGIRLAARRQRVRMPGDPQRERLQRRRAAARGRARLARLPARRAAGRGGARRAPALPPDTGLRLAGTHHGYFDEADSAAIAAQIRGSRASVVMVALGQPRQEQWLERHLAATGAGVGLAVGGFFDFAAGTVRRAPSWMNRAGLEWTFRLAQEPRRLAGRYLVGNPVYLWRLRSATAAFARRRSSSPSPPTSNSR